MISLDEACTCRKPIDSGTVYRFNDVTYPACRICRKYIVCPSCLARLRKRGKIEESDEFNHKRTKWRYRSN